MRAHAEEPACAVCFADRLGPSHFGKHIKPFRTKGEDFGKRKGPPVKTQALNLNIILNNFWGVVRKNNFQTLEPMFANSSQTISAVWYS
jgi:hypothetical protein